MSWSGRPQRLMTWPMLLALLWAAACSRPAGLRTDEGSASADQHQVPFHDRNGGLPDNTQPGDTSPGQDSSPKSEVGLPFRDAQNLPAGTLLTVRLKHPVSAGNPGPNITFEAVIEEPVVIEGNTLVPSGATVTGRVESARVSNLKHNRGYVRLALDSIHIAGSDLPIRTSSLFARGNADETESEQSEAPAPVVSLEKGRRLTFRLAEPLYVASRGAQAGH